MIFASSFDACHIHDYVFVAAGSVDIAEIKYDAIAELSGGGAKTPSSPSSSDAVKARKEVPRNPQTQPDNVCFYRVSHYRAPGCVNDPGKGRHK